MENNTKIITNGKENDNSKMQAQSSVILTHNHVPQQDRLDRKINQNRNFFTNVHNINLKHKPESVNEPEENDELPEDRNVSDERSGELADKPDSVKSGESMFKVFNFEPSKYNTDTDKCVEFWRHIRSRPDIVPVNCTLIEGKHKRKPETNDDVEVVEEIETPWYKALLELKRKHMHTATFAAALTKCKLCKDDHFQGETVYDDDVCALNDWNPKFSDKATNVQHRESLMATSRIKEKGKYLEDDIRRYLLRKERRRLQRLRQAELEKLKKKLPELTDSDQIDYTGFEDILNKFKIEGCSCGVPNCTCLENLEIKQTEEVNLNEIEICRCKKSPRTVITTQATNKSIMTQIDEEKDQGDQKDATICILCGHYKSECVPKFIVEKNDEKPHIHEVKLRALTAKLIRTIQYFGDSNAAKLQKKLPQLTEEKVHKCSNATKSVHIVLPYEETAVEKEKKLKRLHNLKGGIVLENARLND